MRFIVLSILLLFAPLAAAAQSVEEQIMTQLHDQGFTDITMSRTLLGRLRVVALSAEFERELVVNPATGAILRDRITPLDKNEPAQVNILPHTPDTTPPPPPDTAPDQDAQQPQQADDQNEDRPPRPSPPRDGTPPPRDGNPPPRP